MKGLVYILLFFLAVHNWALAQVYNTGTMYIPSGGNAAFHGDLTNTSSGTIMNNGDLYAQFNIRNDGQTTYDTGTLILGGGTQQLLNGAATFNTHNLTINNTSGIILNKRYSVSDQLLFMTGIVTAPNATEPLEFNPGGLGGTAITVQGTSDLSHVNGYMLQWGTGSFIYPSGDKDRYQPIAADLIFNNNGMLCRYVPGDAGLTPYLTTGLDPDPLLHYNSLEYWNMRTTNAAIGTVTIYYDDYNNAGIGPDYLNALKLARRDNVGWYNEGGVVNGTISSGTVTSIGNLNNWGIFTLGSATDISPLNPRLLDFAAIDSNCNTILTWSTAYEGNLSGFEIQYSADGIEFTTIATIRPLGNRNHYNYTHSPSKRGRSYFRICLRNRDGSYSYSDTLTVDTDCGHSITVYPNPVVVNGDLYVRLDGYNGPVKGILYDLLGRKISVSELSNGLNTISVKSIAAAHYELCVYSLDYGREAFKVLVINY